jgi:hypothetical protein
MQQPHIRSEKAQEDADELRLTDLCGAISWNHICRTDTRLQSEWNGGIV